MAAYGYLVYLVRVVPPHRTSNLQRLNSIGFGNVDLLEEIRTELDTLGRGFHRNESKAEGFRVREHVPRGRSSFIHLRRGPVGNPGETFDIDSGESQETRLTTAMLSELRAAVFIPEDSYYGFIFVERVGGRHIKDLIYRSVIVPIAKRLDMIIRMEAFAETDDWRQALAGQQIVRVTEILKKKDSASDASTLEDLTVRISAEGAGVSSRSDDLKARVFDLLDRRHAEYRVLADAAPLEARRTVWGEKTKDGQPTMGWKKAPRTAFTVADAAELEALKLELERLRSGAENSDLLHELQEVLPVDRDEYESHRVEVSLGEDRAEKTFVVAGERVPQLVYEFGGRLLDIELQRAWEAAAEHFLTGLGVHFPTGWLQGT